MPRRSASNKSISGRKEHKKQRQYPNEQFHWKSEYSLKISPPRLILLSPNSMLSENVTGNIIPYLNLCRLVAIHREKDERQTSHFRFGKAHCFIDTDMRIERIIVQFMKGDCCVSAMEIVIKLALLSVAGRHSSVIPRQKSR